MSYYEFHTAKRYIQHEGAMGEFARYSCQIGKRFFVLTGSNRIKDRVQEVLLGSLQRPLTASMSGPLSMMSPKYAAYRPGAEALDQAGAGMRCVFYDVRDLVLNRRNAEEVAGLIRQSNSDVVVGVGGGKALDFARAVTRFTPAKVILIPTTAATNASISQSSVIYNEDGSQIEEYWQMDTTPELVLADTDFLIDMPPETLASGIGDILSTYYEALCNVQLTGSYARHSLLSTEGVRLAIDLVAQAAPNAMEAVRTKEPNQEFETILSLILHNCGPFRAISGVGFAHLLDEVLLYFAPAHKIMHGLRVGFTTVPMLCYQRAAMETIHLYLDLCSAIGIPLTLAQLGLQDIPREAWLEACQQVLLSGGYLSSLPYRPTAADMVDSILDGERLVGQYRKHTTH